MSLSDRITQQLKDAMKARDTVAMETLRAIKSALILKQTEGGKQQIDQGDEQAVLIRLQKQREESALIYRQQGREDLATLEEQQAAVIARFLPEPLSEQALREAIEQIVNELGADSMQHMGRVMALATQRLAGRAAGKRIAQAVRTALSR